MRQRLRSKRTPVSAPTCCSATASTCYSHRLSRQCNPTGYSMDAGPVERTATTPSLHHWFSGHEGIGGTTEAPAVATPRCASIYARRGLEPQHDAIHFPGIHPRGCPLLYQCRGCFPGSKRGEVLRVVARHNARHIPTRWCRLLCGRRPAILQAGFRACDPGLLGGKCRHYGNDNHGRRCSSAEIPFVFTFRPSRSFACAFPSRGSRKFGLRCSRLSQVSRTARKESEARLKVLGCQSILVHLCHTWSSYGRYACGVAVH